MSAGKSGTASPVVRCDRPWGWAEVHWSNDDPNDWKLPGYTCPILEETKMTDIQKHVELIKSVGQSAPSAFNVKQSGSADASQVVQDFKKRNAFICTSVTQWIIVEIQPAIGIEFALMDALPYLQVWGFLQPATIGNRTKMKNEYGYVTDDLPRAGWFQTDICWFKEPVNEKSGRAPFHYVPKMSIRNDENKIANWVQIPCVLTNADWDGLRKIHPKRPSYGQNYRFLLKIPVTVTNILTPGDRERLSKEVEKFARAQSKGGFKHSQVNQMGRMEAGSYLKIWVRNAAFPWNDKDAPPGDDGTTKCMDSMQRLDQAITHSNEIFNKPAISPVVDVARVVNPSDFNSHVEYYYSYGRGMTELLMKDVQRSCPADVVLQQALLSIKKPIIGVPLSAWAFEPLPGEDTASMVKPDHLTFPDLFEERPETEKRYKCGSDFFRPASFRNHTWKRNRFSMSGKYEEDKWYYVLLFPQELLEVTGKFFGDPSRATFPFQVALTSIYILVMLALSSGAKKLQKSKEEKSKPFPMPADKFRQNQLPKKPVSSMAEFCKAILEHEDWPFVIGTLATWGMPNKSEADHIAIQANEPDKDTSKELLNLFARFDAALTSDSNLVCTEKSLYAFYALLQKIFVCLIELDSFKDILDVAELSKTFKSKNAGGSGQERYRNGTAKFFSMSASIKDKTPLSIEAAALDGKIGKPMPFPVPFTFLAAAASARGSLKLTGKIDGADVITQGKPSFGLGLTLAGSGGLHFDVGLFWTLAKELGTAFTGEALTSYTKRKGSKASGSKSWKAKYEANKGEYAFIDVVDDLIDFFNAKIGVAVQVILNGTLNAKADLAQFANGLKKVFSLDERPFNCDISFEIPIKAQISKLEWTLGHLKFPLLAASPAAAMLFPNGMKIEGDFFRGVSFQPFKPVVLKPGKRIPISQLSVAEGIKFFLGSELKLTVDTSNMFDPASLPKINDEVKGISVQITFDASQPKGGRKSCSIEMDSTTTVVSLRREFATLSTKASIPFAQSRLTTDGEYSTLINELLMNDIEAKIQCQWNGSNDPAGLKAVDNNMRLYKPVVTEAMWTNAPKSLSVSGAEIKSANPFDTVGIQFKIDHLDVSGQCLPIKFYELNSSKNWMGAQKTDAKELSIIQGRGFHARAYQKSNGAFVAIVPLGALSTYDRVDESDDDWWEFAYQVYLDLDFRFPIPFVNGATKGDSYSRILKVRKTKSLNL